MNGTITLKTNRLTLRKFKVNDEVDMFKNYCNDSRVCEYLSWRPHETIEKTKMYLQNTLDSYDLGLVYKWAIVDKKTNEVIGSIDARCDVLLRRASLGYVLGYDFWNKGLMTEAVQKVVDYLFSEGFCRIDACHLIDNIASGLVMQKVGMKEEGILKKYVLDKYGKLQDVKMYSITKNEE